ncbi:hypothetical protein R6Z07M_000396 [Ovis aries]
MGRVGRASGGGKKRGRLPQCQLPPPPHLPRTSPQGTARRGQDSGAPVAPASLRPGGRPLSRAEATAARFLGLCDGPERERELPPETTPGDAARRIDRGWELRARTFRKSTGASSAAAPPPPPARLPFRVVTQPAGYAEVCAETRNLRAAGSACLRRRSPGPRGAHPSPAPGLAQGAGAADARRGLHFSEVRGYGLDAKRLVTFTTHVALCGVYRHELHLEPKGGCQPYAHSSAPGASTPGPWGVSRLGSWPPDPDPRSDPEPHGPGAHGSAQL